jgi:ABC-type multidrug transport system ATPase subunit
VHLAKLLKEGGNLLLLDEPSNDLDVDTLRALEDALLNFAGCAVVISHDRWFLDRIATHILAFEGDSRVVWFEGNYQDYEADRKRRLGADADIPHRQVQEASRVPGTTRSTRRTGKRRLGRPDPPATTHSPAGLPLLYAGRRTAEDVSIGTYRP